MLICTTRTQFSEREWASAMQKLHLPTPLLQNMQADYTCKTNSLPRRRTA